ncbi:MFS transporter [Oligoflexus tunisiensis]|uniref:MFS transporter n=1 Tax=Oligoflexus tunisiensis TaxID=708132 RepID=UPI00114C8D92|nr:MFS transporter [Oligoflexus tunisiensis]
MNTRFPQAFAAVPPPLRASLWDVTFYSLMVGMAETYLSAFVLTMGFSERASGLLVTLPMLIGSVIQLASGFCAQFFRSQKFWVMVSASIQGSALVLLALLSYGWTISPLSNDITVFVLISVYWTFGLAAGPSWSSWIGSIVPDEQRTHFFSYRTRVAQFFTLLGLLVAGLALETQSETPQRLPIFALLFFVSGLCRYISVVFLAKHPDSLVRPLVDARALFKKSFWSWLAEKRSLVIILFLFLTQIATNISGPFFNAYMLKQLELDYHDYMILISTAFVARVVGGGVMHKLAHNLGSTTLTHLGALLIAPLPMLWIVSSNFTWLFLIQTFSGFAWGCHELGVTLMILDKHSHRERISLLTITQLLNATATFLGSWIGFMILGAGTLTAANYFHVFILSSVLRFVPVMVLARLGDSRLRGLLIPSRLFSR